METSTGEQLAPAARVCELDGQPAQYHLTAWLAAPWPHYVKGFLCEDCRHRVVQGLLLHKIAHQCVPEALVIG